MPLGMVGVALPGSLDSAIDTDVAFDFASDLNWRHRG
jgi:hypothetical protein